MNSLCGSSASLKNENSRTKNQVQPASSNESILQSKKTITTQSSIDLDNTSTTSLTPQSLNLPLLKFDLDGDIEVQSPDSSMWESFFSDNNLEGDFMISSPIRNFPSPQASTYNSNNYNNYAQGMSLSGCSPPRFSSQIGAYNSSNNNNKGKGLSPLHRVFNSPNNQYMQHVENLSLPAIEEFLEDYQGDEGLVVGGGYPSSSSNNNNKVSSDQCFDMQTPLSSILDSLTMHSSQISHESDIYHQMGSMASASLSQALQEERYQEKQQKQQIQQQMQHQQQLQQQQQQSLTVPIPIGIDQVTKYFLHPASPKSLIQILNYLIS